MKTLFLILSIFFISSICRADVLPLVQPSSTSLMPVGDVSLNAKDQQLKPQLAQAQTQAPVRVSRFSPEDLEDAQVPVNLAGVISPSHRSGAKDLIDDVSPEYVVDRNFLGLSKVPQDRRKRAIMFVFLMNKHKVDPEKPVVLRDNTRTRLHIMGSKKIVNEQKIVDDEYPIDISIAKHDDGYASEEWNLVLPKGKPREVMVSLLWSF